MPVEGLTCSKAQWVMLPAVVYPHYQCHSQPGVRSLFPPGETGLYLWRWDSLLSQFWPPTEQIFSPCVSHLIFPRQHSTSRAREMKRLLCLMPLQPVSHPLPLPGEKETWHRKP